MFIKGLETSQWKQNDVLRCTWH